MKFNIKKGLAGLIAGAGLFFCGCRESLKEGEIYEKFYSPFYEWIDTIPMTSYLGRHAITDYAPIVRYEPERYAIKVKKFNEKKGKWEKGTVYLDKGCFYKVKTGEWFNFDRCSE